MCEYHAFFSVHSTHTPRALTTPPICVRLLFHKIHLLLFMLVYKVKISTLPLFSQPVVLKYSIDHVSALVVTYCTTGKCIIRMLVSNTVESITPQRSKVIEGKVRCFCQWAHVFTFCRCPTSFDQGLNSLFFFLVR